MKVCAWTIKKMFVELIKLSVDIYETSFNYSLLINALVTAITDL